MHWYKNPVMWGLALVMLAMQVMLAMLENTLLMFAVNTSLILGVVFWNFREFGRKFAFNDMFDGQLPHVVQVVKGLPRSEMRMRFVVIKRRVSTDDRFAIKLGLRLMGGLDWYGYVESGDENGQNADTLVFSTFIGKGDFDIVVLYRTIVEGQVHQSSGEPLFESNSPLGKSSSVMRGEILSPNLFEIQITDDPPFPPNATFPPHLIQKLGII